MLNNPDATGYLTMPGMWHYKWGVLQVIMRSMWDRGGSYLVGKVLCFPKVTPKCKEFEPAHKFFMTVSEGIWRAMFRAFKRSEHIVWMTTAIKAKVEAMHRCQNGPAEASAIGTAVREIMLAHFMEWYHAGVALDPDEFGFWAGMVLGIGNI